MNLQECQDAFARFVSIVTTLRGEGGCPWDRAQDHRSLLPYLVEEAHEVMEAMEAEDPASQCEELGDLLFQIVIHAQIADEAGQYDIGHVLEGISRKMIRRHPHVFGGPAEAGTAGTWEARKALEHGAGRSMLDGIPVTLPALLRAHRVAERVSRVGFDWPDISAVQAKVREEQAELDEALASGSREAVVHEYGDLLLSVANLGRFLGIGPEEALRTANKRFEGRFRRMEKMALADHISLHGAGPEALDDLWERVKAEDSPPPGRVQP